MKRKIIIDCDPGIDDSLALIYAIQHPDLEVVALTIVAGNVPVDLGVENAFKILERLNRLDISVYAGAEKPLVRDFVSAQDTPRYGWLRREQNQSNKQLSAPASESF